MNCAFVVNCRHYLFVTSVRPTGTGKPGHRAKSANAVCQSGTGGAFKLRLSSSAVTDTPLTGCRRKICSALRKFDIRAVRASWHPPQKGHVDFQDGHIRMKRNKKSFSHVYWLLPTVGFENRRCRFREVDTFPIRRRFEREVLKNSLCRPALRIHQ